MKYDVIVLGAGSAGCVLAGRLSEDPGRSVLLLEAGPDYPSFEQIPDELKYGTARNYALEVNAVHNWSLWGTATPQQPDPNAVPQGKVVGGSSAINGQMFVRGLPEDYDDWASWGNTEWPYLKVLPYLRKIETDLDIHDDFHGSEGPIPVRRFKREEFPPPMEAFYKACLELGYPESPDLNHPEALGISPCPMNNHEDVRMSTAITYLNPARHRLNLTVKAKVVVKRILFSDKRASAVEVESDGETFTVEGDEIVLSAGATASPKLLMLSGVGAADHLSSLGIPIVHDLPGVGQNFRDHPGVFIGLNIKEEYRVDPDSPNPRIVLRYTAQGSPTRGDMQIVPARMAGPYNVDDLQIGEVRIVCRLYLAKSAGQVRLTSTDPHVQPYLDFKFLEDPWDRERFREGVRIIMRLLKQDAIKDMIKEIVTPTEQDMTSDETLDSWLMRHVVGGAHFTGTCKMGPSSDPMAVVDQYGRVRGVEGLRVSDASIIPEVPRANTNCSTIMVAERVAEWIKEGK